jgi:hypothetical protein
VPNDHGVTPDPPGCPRCGAHARRGAQWCTLCYADLRPAPARSRRAEPVRVTVPATPDPAPVAVAMTGRGKHARQGATVEESPAEPGLPPRLSDEEALRSADAMLAMLAAEQTKPLPGLYGRLDSKGARVAVTAGGMALVAVLLFLVMAVLGTMI